MKKFMHKILYIVDILFHPLIVFQIGILFWIVLIIRLRRRYLRNKLEKHHPTWQLYFIFLNTYQSAKIMVATPLNMVRHIVSAKTFSQMMKEGNIYTNKLLAFIWESIHKFHKYYYNAAIDKISFSLSHVRIL